MADKFTYENSSEALNDDDYYFTSKNWQFVNDNCNSNYGGSNQITFDLSSLYNADAFINPSEMFLTIPLVSVMSCNKSLTTLNNDYCLGFKNGYHHLISSIQVEYCNKTVQQLIPNINTYVSFKRISQMNYDKLKNEGSLYGFYPDNLLLISNI